MPDEFHFDARSMERLGRDLRAAGRSIRREVERTMLEIGVELTAKAKAIANEHSSTVAGTVTMVPAAPGTIVIRIGSDDVPIAALWEKGNKGSKVTDKTFRHPVFGSDVWVEQPRWPALRPALREDRASITRRMNVAWDRALEPYRLKPSGGE